MVAKRETGGLLYYRAHAPPVDMVFRGVTVRLEPCFYCGMPANSVDHVPPVSIAMALLDTGAMAKTELITVPSCKDCNVRLGAHPAQTPAKRRDVVREKLRAKLEKLGRVVWSEEELKELGPNLKREIRRSMRAADLLRQRIAWDMPSAALQYSGRAPFADWVA